MSRLRPRVILVLLLAVGAAACSSTSQHGLIANPTADPAGLLDERVTFREIGPVEGRACRYSILSIIPVGNSSVGNAMINALAGTSGDAVASASVTTSLYSFVPYFNILAFTCTTVQGVAVAYDEPDSEEESPQDSL